MLSGVPCLRPTPTIVKVTIACSARVKTTKQKKKQDTRSHQLIKENAYLLGIIME
jgi:hypothetical protein